MKTDAEILNKIHQNFDALMNNVECIIDPFNPMKALIVTAASGVGKSFNLIRRLDEAQNNLECSYSKISGKCTDLGLYQALYNARGFNHVLLLDDVDVFSTETKLDLLKAALETSNKRDISYISNSKMLKDQGIPTSFEFKGKVIFISNKNFVQIMKSKSKMASHMKALVTRNTFVDLGIHEAREIMIQIEDVMKKTNIVKQYNLTDAQSDDILQFMKQNFDRLLEPSLRTPVNLSALVLKYPNTWKETAKASLMDI